VRVALKVLEASGVWLAVRVVEHVGVLVRVGVPVGVQLTVLE